MLKKNKAEITNTEDESVLVADASKKAQQGSVKGEVITTEINKTAEQASTNNVAVEHKLKAFADEVDKNKVGNRLGILWLGIQSNAELLSNKELLNRYQQQLQLKDDKEPSKEPNSEALPVHFL